MRNVALAALAVGLLAIPLAAAAQAADSVPGSTGWLLVVLFPLFGGIGALAAAHRDPERGFVLPHRLAGERPAYDAGFAGDFVLGAAGAIAILLIVPGNLDSSNPFNALRALALAVIGGYGARAVLEAALTSRLAKVEEAAKAARDEAAALARRRARAEAAKRAVQSHLEGTEPRKSEEFDALFTDLPSDGPLDLFRMADEKRSDWRKAGRRDEIARVLPVLEALERVEAPIPPAELQAAIAMTYFDKSAPEFDKALERIEQAIALAQAKPAKYLIIRAVSLIMLALDGQAAEDEAAEALRALHAAQGWIENAEYRGKVNDFAIRRNLGITIPDTRPGT